jgi:TonB family protein
LISNFIAVILAIEGKTMYFASILLYVSVTLAFVPFLAGQNSPNVLPEIVEHSQPAYPPLARQARIQGDVRVRFKTDGELVKEAEAVSGQELLRKAAEENVRTWRFVPHTPATFYVTFRYKLASGDVDVEFLEVPAIVEIEASPPVAIIDYEWIDIGTWKAKLTSANGNSLRTFKLRYSGPHAEWVDGSILDANGNSEEIDFGHKEGDFVAFTVKLRHADGRGRMTFFVGNMKGNNIVGTFVDDVGMTGKWTATRAPNSL